MPLTTIDFNQPSSGMSILEAANQNAIRRLQYGDPFDQVKPEQAGLFETSFAMLAINEVNQTIEQVYRPPQPDPREQAEPFNPYQFIDNNPELKNDPRVQQLVEAGQFEQAYGEEQFWFDLQSGLGFMNQVETIGRSGTGAFLGGMALTAAFDPANAIPIGAGANAVRKMRNLGRLQRMIRIARDAGVSGAAVLALEQHLNRLQPISEEEGIGNEVFAFSMGAGLVSAFGLTSEAFRAAGRGMTIPRMHKKIKQANEDLITMGRKAVLRDVDPTAPRAGDDATIIGEGGVSLMDNFDRSTETLDRLLADDHEPVPHQVVSVLRREGDDNDQKLKALQEKYDAAGVPLQVVEHPHQAMFDQWDQAVRFANASEANLDANPRDLNYTSLRALAQTTLDKYSDVQSVFTPGGRLHGGAIAKVFEAYRTLSGSVRTVPKESAQNFAYNASGASAEAFSSLQRTFLDQAHIATRQVFNDARRQVRETGQPVTYKGNEINTSRFRVGALDEFNEAVGDYLIEVNNHRRGFTDQLPDDVHPSIKQAAEEVRGYYRKMRDIMEEYDMLHTGPRRLSDVDARIRDFETKAAEMQARADEHIRMAEQRVETDLADPRPRLSSNFTRKGLIERGFWQAANDLEQEVSNVQQIVDAHKESARGEGSTVQFTELEDADFAITPRDWAEFSDADRKVFEDNAKRHDLAFKVHEPSANEVEDIIGTRKYHQLLNKMLTPMDTKKKRSQAAFNWAESLWKEDDILMRPEGGPGLADAVVLRAVMLNPDAKGRPRVTTIDPESMPFDESFNLLDQYEVTRVEIDGEDMIRIEDIANEEEVVVPTGFMEGQIPLDPDAVQQSGILKTVKPQNLQRLEQIKARKAKIEQRLAERRAKLRKERAQVQRAIDMQENYMPVVYNVEAVLADRDGFVDTLAREFRRADELLPRERDGQTVPGFGDTAARAIRREVYEDNASLRASIDELAEAKGVDVEDITLADLDEARLMVAYEEQLDAFYRRNAEHVYGVLTGDRVQHGVANVYASQDPTMSRVMDIDHGRMQRYMHKDVEMINDRYHRAISGRLAIRRAIRANPKMWAGAKLRKAVRGRHDVHDHETLIAYLEENLGALDGAQSMADRIHGHTGSKAHAPKIRSQNRAMLRDIKNGIDNLAGTNYIDISPAHRSLGEPIRYGIRNALRLSYANKLGSVLWSMVNDLAPVSLYLMQRPRVIRQIPNMIRGMKSMNRRDLQLLGAFSDSITQRRSRAFGDLDFHGSPEGMGTGNVKRVTSQVERGIQGASDFVAKMSLMDWFTNFSKRMAATVLVDRVNTMSKRLLRATRLMANGMDETAALRKAGLSKFDAAWVNNMGFNADRARWFHRKTWRHGSDLKGKPLREKYDEFEDYLEAKEPVIHNFDDWGVRSDRERRMFDTIRANINDEVNRNMVVTPGAFDRPIINRTEFGKMFNQLQTFMLAFANQRVRTMAQMPASYQLWYQMAYLALGAFTEAISAHLSGFRSFDETADLWEENPLGGIYNAWDRSGLSAALARPMAIADQLGFGPGAAAGVKSSTAAARHYGKQNVLSAIGGPAVDDMQRLSSILSDTLTANADSNTAVDAWKLIPAQNLLWFRLLHEASGLPVVPQSLRE